jgi:rod shape determining protein RodA
MILFSGNFYKKLISLSILQKFFYRLRRLHFSIILMTLVLAGIGVGMLFSAAKGSLYPWGIKQATYISFSFVFMLLISVADIRLLYRVSYLMYFIGLLLLLTVSIFGYKAMGAARWLNLGFIKLQPSELMKIFLILALARYFHNRKLDEIKKVKYLIIPIFITILPCVLLLRQPDLGTALILIMITGTVLFVAGVQLWKFAVVLIAAGACLPLGWNFLHEYQKNRILIFLDPERDPLGSGYNIIQSKIAIGSGGFWGKGFLNGSQAQLNFLPERHTDFIFTMLAEEWGFFGAMLIISLYMIITIYSFYVSLSSNNFFGKILSFGVGSLFFFHMFINVAMVMGLIPAKGSPFPFLSYGGTITTATFFGVGIILNVYLNRKVMINYGTRTLM